MWQLGTSLPDTFASMLSIQAEETSDNAIGNLSLSLSGFSLYLTHTSVCVCEREREIQGVGFWGQFRG
jgi:Ca2+/Na+ antiporter